VGLLNSLLSWREIWEFVGGSERVFLALGRVGRHQHHTPFNPLFNITLYLHYLFCPFTAIIQGNIQHNHLILVFFLLFYSSDYFLITLFGETLFSPSLSPTSLTLYPLLLLTWSSSLSYLFFDTQVILISSLYTSLRFLSVLLVVTPVNVRVSIGVLDVLSNHPLWGYCFFLVLSVLVSSLWHFRSLVYTSFANCPIWEVVDPSVN